jgi:xanthine dehydrogenase accessory factor
MFDPQRLAAIAAGPAPAAVVTVVATSGSTPRKAGASMVVVADGSEHGHVEGTIGGGAVEHRVRREALEAIALLRPRLIEVALTTQLGMCCGGQMSLYIEPLRLRPPLVVFGAGHVSQALCALASRAGFDVSVADPREDLLTAERLPDAVLLVDDYEREDLDRLPFGPDCFVVVATHDHGTDQKLAELVLARPFRYAALVGSQRKALLTRERCAQKGIAADRIASLVCPAGLDIGAETPEEIALSITAQMVEVRRKAEASSRRTKGAAAKPLARS